VHYRSQPNAKTTRKTQKSTNAARHCCQVSVTRVTYSFAIFVCLLFFSFILFINLIQKAVRNFTRKAQFKNCVD